MGSYIGTATSRVDGLAKVTGAAKYAGEFNDVTLAHCSVVTSDIAKGRITRIDTSEASRVAGVIDILTHRNRRPMASTNKAYCDDTAPAGSPYRPLYDDRILFSHQPVALVVADDTETARFAASLVRVDYRQEPHSTDVFQRRYQDVEVAPGSSSFGPPRPRGLVQETLCKSEVRHEGEYYVPIEHHNPMELFAATVIWHSEGKLTIWDKTQGVQNIQRYICNVFDLKPDDIRVMSPFMGGGFGSGLRPQYEVALATLAALTLKRSVRLVLTRQQMYALGYRPAMVQRVTLGASAEGTLNAIGHDAVTVTSTYENFHRQETGWSGLLYKCPSAEHKHHLVPLDLPTPCDMRAPSAATGVYALEAAMDELAIALRLDPLELRLRNYSKIDQNSGRPYTSKALRECYLRGAEAFGWEKRNPEPRSMRDGSDLVGWGMATGVWEALQVPTAVRITLSSSGNAEVACATSDIGTGTYTIMAQVAADMLGLPMENISVKLGDSSLPHSPVEGGSWMATSVASAIAATCDAIRGDLLELTRKMPESALADVTADAVVLVDGKLASKKDPSRCVLVADAMRHGKKERIEREAMAKPTKNDKHSANAHSAIFVEVKVDAQLGVIRVTRVVSAVAAGRILNTKTAHSQIMGAIVGGIGMALHEETLIDHTFGRIMNADIAEYHVPVNADIHDIRVIFVDEPDAIINRFGMKGVGEIGIVGVAAAVGNAISHATGKRVRRLPITLDKLVKP